jgi:hypothetical protein
MRKFPHAKASVLVILATGLTGWAASAGAASPATFTPTVTTQLSGLVNGVASFVRPVIDQATLQNASPDAAGTVSYGVYSNNTCTTLVQALGTKPVVDGVVGPSDPWVSHAMGNFWFQATYSGDANNAGPVSSPCPSEAVTCCGGVPSVNTQLVPPGPVTIGTPVYDTASLTGATANAGGTVSYAVYSNNLCTVLVQALGTKIVTNGVVPDSDVWTPKVAGDFWFQATYSGDPNNTGPLSSACLSEPLRVLSHREAAADESVGNKLKACADGQPVSELVSLLHSVGKFGASYNFGHANIEVGTAGNDRFTDTAGVDIICGLGGNDTVPTLHEGDVFIGGDGSDGVGQMLGGTFIGGPGNDTVTLVSGGTFVQ